MVGIVSSVLSLASGAEQFDLHGPPGSGAFGTSVTVLPNGNFVVTDPDYDLPGGQTNVGAVYLYRSNGILISMLTGSLASDAIGSGGVSIVGAGNFVVKSPDWSNGSGNQDAGAVTWGSGSSGIAGVVSAANSLVGTKANDRVGSSGITQGGITLLTNGNFVVSCPNWGNGTTNSVGAVTWGNGNFGVNGEVSEANSIVGSALNDQIGRHAVEPLKNGNFLIRSPQWDHGALVDSGALTWGSGTGVTAGAVGPTNSLVGGSANDQIGFKDSTRGGVTTLENGSYVLWSPFWDHGSVSNAGAVTWGSGTTAQSGVISASNSLVGVTASDFFSWVEISELDNGNYIVCLPGWDNGSAADAGAAMWCDGNLGLTGSVSSSNALIGTSANALVGYSNAVTALTNGNYVVSSTYWHNGAVVNAGAVTWCNGMTGRVGTISSANSLVGTEPSNNIGSGGVLALPNGHYVVCSPYAKIGALGSAGAATWCDGTTGRSGTLSAANSLVGAKAGDSVGLRGAKLLTNGNYVVTSYFASNGALTTAGAVTWCNGSTGRTGAISTTNSLMGGKADDRVGNGEVMPLANGHYVVSSSSWKNAAGVAVGAVSWCDGTTGRTGTVTSANSLVGSTAGDNVGYPGLIALPNGHYLVPTVNWDNGAAVNAGAVTWGNGNSGVIGEISVANSLVGTSASDQIGYGGIVVLTDGNYVIRSYLWDNGAFSNSGAVTWGSGTSGVVGEISAANSIIGVTTNDRVGEGLDLVGSDGAYLFSNPKWNRGALSDAGSVVLFPSGSGAVGAMPSSAGVLGAVATRGSSLSFSYDAARDRAVIGQLYQNRVSLFSHQAVFSPRERFQLWASGSGLQDGQNEPESLPFGDGVTNLLKYAFNLNGASADLRVLIPGGTAGLPNISTTADGLRFRMEYLRRIGSGLNYIAMVSESLEEDSFVPMGGTEAITEINAEWERVVREEALILPRLFGRVKVSLP